MTTSPTTPNKPLTFHNIAPSWREFYTDVVHGLAQPQKEISSKYLYDEQGSHCFDAICESQDYYPTRTEIGIMQQHMNDIAERLGENSLLVEYGSGNSAKSRILLDGMKHVSAYVPVDISETHLRQAACALSKEYPDLEILPVCADYTRYFHLPTPEHHVSRCNVYYPGSTIGNYHPDQALHLLQHIALVCGSGGGLLIGVDLKKDPQVLHRAYNDHDGATAAFNLNLLSRINRELGATFPIEQFAHYAFYNPPPGRVEMHIVSLTAQDVRIGNTTIPFTVGETIWTESSYKYTLPEFIRLAHAAGFDSIDAWTDENHLFSIHYLRAR